MEAALKEIETSKLIKIDIGCGARKYKGPKGDETDWVGVDAIAFDGVDHVVDVTKERLPFKDASVSEVYTSHFIEHLTGIERVQFVNELYRVLVPGGKCTMIAPHWSSSRAYGDFTHQWPPIGEFWFYYLSRKWRLDDGNAPHCDIKHSQHGYTCDFECTWGYGMHPALVTRNTEYQQHALNFFKEAVQDIHATLTKK